MDKKSNEDLFISFFIYKSLSDNTANLF